MKYFLKSILLTILLIIFIPPSKAGEILPECHCMLWGYVYAEDNKGEFTPVADVLIKIEDPRGEDLETKTDKRGVFSVNYYYDNSGYVALKVNGTLAVNIMLQNHKAVGKVVFGRYSTNGYYAKCFTDMTQGLCDIVYITESGTCYHRYGCQYLYDSCKPIPETYCVNNNYTACYVCNP